MRFTAHTATATAVLSALLLTAGWSVYQSQPSGAQTPAPGSAPAAVTAAQSSSEVARVKDKTKLPGYEVVRFANFPLPVGRAMINDGQQIFESRCASCHGEKGDKIKKHDLSAPENLFYGSEARDIYRSFMYGFPKIDDNHKFARLEDRERIQEYQAWALTSYVLGLGNPPEGVTTPSGLQYAILRRGRGAKAQMGNTVNTHYTGWLTNGQIFDSSYARRKPFAFKLGAHNVIKGWEEGVQGMQIGELRQMVLPAHLAYGQHGSPPTIAPNATLIFQVELVGIE